MGEVHYLRPDKLLAQAEGEAMALYAEADNVWPLQDVIFAYIRAGRHDRAMRLLKRVSTGDRSVFWDFLHAKALAASGDLVNACTMAMKLLPRSRARMIGEIAWRYAEKGNDVLADRMFRLAFGQVALLDHKDKRDDLRGELVTLLAYSRPEAIGAFLPVAVEDAEDLVAMQQAAVGGLLMGGQVEQAHELAMSIQDKTGRVAAVTMVALREAIPHSRLAGLNFINMLLFDRAHN